MTVSRGVLGLLIAASFVTAEPVVVPQTAEARTLFETLFPRAAKRRKAREARRRERIRVIEGRRQRALLRERQSQNGPAVSAPRYKRKVLPPYKAASLRDMPLSQLKTAVVKERTNLEKAHQLALTSTLNRGLQKERLSLDQAVRAMAAVSVLPAFSFGDALAGVDEIALKGTAKQIAAVRDHYAANPAFLWLGADGQPTDAARAIANVLETADQYGLTSNHYAVRFPLAINASTGGAGTDLPEIESAGRDLARPDLARFDLELSLAALRYATDAKHGLVTAEKLSRFHDFRGNKADPKALFDELLQADDKEAFLIGAHPKVPAFETLRQELLRLMEEARQTKTVDIKAGTFLKPGVTNDQVGPIVEAISLKASAKLREKHASTLGADHSAGLYNPEVVALVKDFQREARLKPDGIVGRRTIAKMKTASPKSRLDRVRLSMERLRWHPDEFGQRYVFINQPAYRASYRDGGKTKLSMKVIIGKQSNQTYFFHDKIEYVEYNPYWGVPRSILVNQMLPRLRANPGYLDAKGWEVTTGSGRRISSSSVNWNNVGANFPYNVRQPPGGGNALGELKIMFPNRHAIYMHDTPAKNLFRRSKRNFSHGCVRLEDPRAMAAAVLGTSVSQVSARISGGKNRKQSLSTKLPVYVAYFTAWPDDAGRVHFYGDVYGRDKALLDALTKEDRKRRSAGRA
ncbi:MAG: L,D-transpeptidase family protein [Pseudomonadota bacterium]